MRPQSDCGSSAQNGQVAGGELESGEITPEEYADWKAKFWEQLFTETRAGGFTLSIGSKPPAVDVH